MFITFEGTEGGGKTTQISLTAEYLRKRGYDLLLTREPGGTDIGDRIREILLEKGDVPSPMHARTELLLFCASRAQIVAEVIRPHLESGGVVLCDRYIDSTFAYQGYGHGLDLPQLKSVVEFATGGLTPDVTVFLDITPENGLKRRAEASLFGAEWNRLDNMDLAFHRRVYDGYMTLIKAEPTRWARIDALQSIDAVQAEIRRELGIRLPAPSTRKQPEASHR
jgi:dTMP kinase